MNRIIQKFNALKETGRKGLIAYLTAGDPDSSDSEKNIRTALEGGVDILELGVPFSDPTADGPIIQEAAQRALSAGMSVSGVIEMVARLRSDFDTPIVLFGYANPFHAYGYSKICADAARAGVDGMLIVDMPYEESAEFRIETAKRKLSFIQLIAPTTSKERARVILREAEGFVYYIMVTGVTGARCNIANDVADHVRALRECTDLPVAVGFGISNGDQARQAAQSADAVVVGSALVQAACENRLAELVRELRSAL